MMTGIIWALVAGLMLGLYALSGKFTQDFKEENTWGLFFMQRRQFAITLLWVLSTTGYADPLGSPDLEEGLKGRQDIVYFTDFESEDWGKDWSGFGHTQNMRLVDSQSSKHLHEDFRGKALEVSIKKGEFYGLSGKFVCKDKLGYEPEELYVRFYTYYAKDFGDQDGSQGYRGKAPGFDGTYGVEGWGGKPNIDGTKGWSCRGASSGGSEADGVRFGFYSYAVKTGQYNYGQTLRYDKPIPYDTWTCVEQYIKLNTPGKNDGVARAWINGELVFEKTDYLWRTTNKLKIYSYWVDYYRGGKQPAYHNHHVYLDNLVIATGKRVGLYASASLPGESKKSGRN